jgi:NCS2 family nucleobase:cation symporter-2
MKKPVTLVYGSEDRPPLGVTVLTGIQHAGMNAIFLLFPLLVSREGGLSTHQIGDVLSLAMIVMAAATVIQAYPLGPVGARLFCPAIYSAIYLGPSLAAVKAGGMPLVFGMTIFAGVVECALARILPFLRPIFPPEVAGLIILLIGLTNGTIGVRNLLGIGAAQPLTAVDLTIGLASFAVMIVLNVWTKGLSRVFCGLIGIALGYVAAAALGRVGGANVQALTEAPLANLPGFAHLGWSFDAAFAITFAVAAVSATTKAMGAVTSYQKLNDAAWVRPNMRSVSGGVLADGLATVGAGLFGSIGMNPSASSLGLTTATGVSSRRVALAIGGIFALLAFLPKVAMAVALIPRPVIGAALVFTAAFILVSGLEVITSRMLDAVAPWSSACRSSPPSRSMYFPRSSPACPPGCGRSSTTRSRSGHSWRSSSTPCSASAFGGANEWRSIPRASTPTPSTTSWARRVRRGEPGATSSTGRAST